MKRGRVILVTLGLLATFACNQILGTPDPELCKIGLALPPGSCAECIADNCCAESTACAAHASCNEYESCTLACGADYACRAACLAKQPVVTSGDLPALDHCVASRCEAACGLSCGIALSPQQPEVAQECQDCIVKRACDPAETCGQSADCSEFIWCILGCPTTDCAHQCWEAHPEGLDDFMALYSSLGNGCTTCNSKGYFACVGNVTWPLAKSNAINVTLGITDSSSQLPAGLTVKACDAASVDCANPLATGTTDAKGRVTLSLAAIHLSLGFSGYFEITGGNIAPYLYFLSFPLSEPEAELDLLLATKDRFASIVHDVVRPQPDGGALPFTPDPSRGTVALQGTDCLLFGAPGITFQAKSGTDEATILRYYDGQTLSNTTTSTDRSGLAFFLDVPTGRPIVIDAVPTVLGRRSSTVKVFVRAGWLSLVQAFPTP
jgi:hypothetical protein